MRSYLVIFIVSIFTTTGMAQMPSSWTVNAPSYNYSMTLTGFIIDSCTELNNDNNAVAAFVGGQCRGMAHTNVTNSGKKLAFLTIYSNNVSGEQVQLQFYNAATGAVKISLDSTVFQSNATVGNVSSPFQVTTNHAPTNLQLSNYVVQEATPIGGFIGNFSAQDIDAFQTLQFLLVGDSLDNSSFTISGSQLQLNTVLNFAVKDTYDILVEVNDGYSCSLQDTFTIVVDDNAFPPVAENDTTSTLEDVVLEIFPLLNDSDYDNDIDTASLVVITAPLHGNVTVDSGGRITYQPDLNFFGMDSMMYRISDLTNTGPMSDSAWIFIDVIAVPDPPVAMADSSVSNEDEVVQVNVLANDTDVENDIDPGSIQIVIAPQHGEALAFLGIVDYTPYEHWYGKDSLQYVICDSTQGGPLCDTAWLYLDILPVPDQPYGLYIDTLIIEEDNQPYAYISLMRTDDYDLPEDAFQYTLEDGGADNHHFEIIDNRLFLRSRTNYAAKQSYSFRIRSTDLAGLTIEKDFVLYVQDIPGNNIPLPVTAYISNNQDGKNDFFFIEDVDIYSNFKLTIFDQFGGILYQVEEGYKNDFDGRVNGNPLPSGAYYYWFRNDVIDYKGNLTIVN